MFLDKKNDDFFLKNSRHPYLIPPFWHFPKTEKWTKPKFSGPGDVVILYNLYMYRGDPNETVSKVYKRNQYYYSYVHSRVQLKLFQFLLRSSNLAVLIKLFHLPN